MKKVIRALSVFLPLVATGATGAAQADDAQALRSQLKSMASLHASFKQTVTDVNHKPIQSGSGVFALSSPNRFYWHLTAPDESQIVADGQSVWIYNPFAEEVTVMDMDKAIQASPIALLVHSDEQTWSQYKVNKQRACYDIRPKTLDSGVVAVSVCFDDKTLTEFQIEDDQGNLSRFALSQQRGLSDKEAGLFQFAVPENVDLDDQRIALAE
jgi:outer membrane lipoprotein carrier protein